MLVGRQDTDRTDAYIGVLIDRSGSMRGEKIELARRFGALVAESAAGVRRIVGHVSAFDDSTFYELGGLTRNAIASLDSGAGNNDAGGLERAAELARQSGKRNKMIIVVSDGSPTQCTVQALQGLVDKLTREGIILAQAAVDQVEHDCFRHAIDLSKEPMDRAVARFGRMLTRLTHHWH